jgi:tetratricopeptide (TPR) repeat protein
MERHGMRPEAAAELRAALRVAPGEARCSGFLARLYALEGINLDEAAELAAVARRARPREAEHIETEGWVRYRQGRVEEARELLELAALRSGRAETYERLGDACFALGLWRRARGAWRRALELEPDRPGPRRKLKRIGRR